MRWQHGWLAFSTTEKIQIVQPAPCTNVPHSPLQSCTTLTHERVHSDHVAILLDIAIDTKNHNNITRTVRSIKKVDWQIWTETMEEKFSTWPEEQSNNLTKDYEAFTNIMQTALDDIIPAKPVRIKKDNQYPCWMNETVKKAKKHLNYSIKIFKKRNNIANFERLKEAEVVYKNDVEEAKEEWAKTLVIQLDEESDPGRMWAVYKRLVKKDTEYATLPLIDEGNNIIFNDLDKCKLLEKVFFDEISRLSPSFDTAFSDQIEDEYKNISASQDLNNQTEFFNQVISLDEVIAAIEMVKLGKSPGPDGFFPELFHYAGDNLMTVICDLINQSWASGVVPQSWKHANVKFI